MCKLIMNHNSNEISSFCITECVFCTCTRMIIFCIKLLRDILIIFHSRGQFDSYLVICCADVLNVRLRQVQLHMQHTSLEFPSGCISRAFCCCIHTTHLPSRLTVYFLHRLVLPAKPSTLLPVISMSWVI